MPTNFKVTYVGDGLGVSHANHPEGAKFQRSRVLGVILCLCLHPLTQNNQIRRDNAHGEGLFFRRSARPSIPRRRGASGPQLCGFSVTYAYTVGRRTTKVRVVIHMGWPCFTPLHLHQCVARFFSNSWDYYILYNGSSSTSDSTNNTTRTSGCPSD